MSAMPARSFGPLDIIYGITANNNPTVQDLEHHAGMGFPYAASRNALGPTQR